MSSGVSGAFCAQRIEPAAVSPRLIWRRTRPDAVLAFYRIVVKSKFGRAETPLLCPRRRNQPHRI
jgi:hypothetical protein